MLQRRENPKEQKESQEHEVLMLSFIVPMSGLLLNATEGDMYS